MSHFSVPAERWTCHPHDLRIARMRLLWLAVFVASAGCATAFAQPAAQTTSRAQQPTQSSAARQARILARADIRFMEQAAQNNHAEIESGRIAMRKAAHPEVKAFAQQMVDDHTRKGAELRALASSKGVSLPEKPSPLQQAQLKVLDAFEGEAFDRRYTERMALAAHRDTIELFETGTRTPRDADVRAFAKQTLPALHHHYEMAQRLPTAQGTERAAGSRR